MFNCMQLIYDFKDGTGSLGFISLKPDELEKEVRLKFEEIGVRIPRMMYVIVSPCKMYYEYKQSDLTVLYSPFYWLNAGF